MPAKLPAPSLRTLSFFALVIGMVMSPTTPRLWAKGTPPPVLTSVTSPLTVGTITMAIQGTGSTSGALASPSEGPSSDDSSAPTLTSVAPNPVLSGETNVTLTGTNFTSSTLVYQTYTGETRIQIAPTSWTATTITVGIYQPPSTSSVTFEVANPGPVWSNAITAPVTAGSGGGGGGGGSGPYTLTVVHGTIQGGGSTGAFAGGSTVTIVSGKPPAGEDFQIWGGQYVEFADATASTTTMTMPNSNTTVTAYFYKPSPVPFPVTTHPHLWITQEDLPRLQQWVATPGNKAYSSLLKPLGWAQGNYQLAFPPALKGQSLTNPIPAANYPDLGDTQGYTGMITEENAVVLALNSLINPNSSNRIVYAQEARNLLMYVMNQAVLGHAQNVPFRDPQFLTYNRGSFGGHEWPLIVDWIYDAQDSQGHNILTAADKKTIRSVFMLWANDFLHASTTGGDNPGTPGLINSLALLGGGRSPNRYASNNYFLAHARNLTMMSLVLDPADDPPINPALPTDGLGNSLRSYVNDATGAWLYEEFAMMGDPATVAKAYDIASNPAGRGLGLASGGLPPEGMLYGESFAYLLGELLALETSGFDNPEYSGPQIALIGAPVWDRYVQGYISSLTPTPHVPASESYLGSVYQFAGYGDMLRLYVTPDQVSPWALLGLLDRERGITTHTEPARWFALDAVPNGPAGVPTNEADFTTWGVTPNILYFLFLDPTAAAPTDPRPTFPKLFYDAPAGRIVAHSDWTSKGTMFDYRASWITINHQDGAAGEFELFRKGEWLTKEMSNYDNSRGGYGETTTYHNTLDIENDCPACATITFGDGLDTAIWQNGSQWMEGENAGDPTTLMSSGPGYVYAASTLTNLYNKPDIWDASISIVDVKQATRSILWLGGTSDFIVTYDRAATSESGLYKKYNLSLVTSPRISPNEATEIMPDGQELFIQTLLPMSASQSFFNGAAAMDPLADLEPTVYIYQVQNSANPASARFLHVLQGSDSGTPMAKATYLQSTAGQHFDGAAFSTYAVYFPTYAEAFTGTTLTIPAAAKTVMVTGLAPNTGYQVTVAGSTITISPNGPAMSDNAGLLLPAI